LYAVGRIFLSVAGKAVVVSLKAGLYRFHRAVADPRCRGPLQGACRALLWPAEATYGAVVCVRDLFYGRGWLKAHRAGLPVISVGNITAGGTGKTPLVAWLARFLLARGHSPAILSRGYGQDAGLGVDDENAMLASLVPEAPVVVNPDRLEGARLAREHAGVDVLILDDGFQHRRIARDLDIVLLDALMPFGGGHLLPCGYLREPPGALGRADVVVLTRTDLVEPERLEEIKERVVRYAPHAAVACCVHNPCKLTEISRGQAGPEVPLGRLAHGRWAAFCGIGNPDGFRRTLEKLGAQVAVFFAFPDHHPYRAREVERVLQAATAAGCEGVVTTQKDAAKAGRFALRPSAPPVFVLHVEVCFTAGLDVLQERVLRAVGERQR